MVGRSSSCSLPPGFRFHPTDEELIMYYLRNQATSKPCPVSIIPEVDLYKFDPWELPEKTEFGESEWYFFTPRDRKYPNGVRPNRAAVSGYWKATGTDKAIYSGSKYVGVKKALVFYKGRPPKGLKTDWIMHEYRLSESRSQPYKQSGSMRLDDWVLCRIYKKKNLGKSNDEQHRVVVEDSFAQILTNDRDSCQPPPHKFPGTCSLTHLWDFDNMSSISQLLLNDPSSFNFPFNNTNNYQETTTTTNNSTFSGGSGGSTEGGAAGRHQLGHVQQPCTDSRKSQVNQTIFVNPVYELQ